MQAPYRVKPANLIALLTVVLLVLLAAAYVATMHAVLEVSRIDATTDTDRRDQVYAYIHVGFLLGAAILGFFAGKWFNGLGIAFATLFLVVLAILMLAVQLGSYELACHGHNDLVRHWQC